MYNFTGTVSNTHIAPEIAKSIFSSAVPGRCCPYRVPKTLENTQRLFQPWQMQTIGHDSSLPIGLLANSNYLFITQSQAPVILPQCFPLPPWPFLSAHIYVSWQLSPSCWVTAQCPWKGAEVAHTRAFIVSGSAISITHSLIIISQIAIKVGL